jgi:RHS repeat-associated protein
VKVWSATHHPFGGVHVSTGTLPANRFPGQWFQSESGLHQNWMRDYDPTTGRYLQADPLGLVDGASVYGYARQSPQMWTDPRGERTGSPTTDLWCFLTTGAASCIVPEESMQCTGTEEERCEIIRDICHRNCVNYFVEGPFPGRDQFAGYRKCMKSCMEGYDCEF